MERPKWRVAMDVGEGEPAGSGPAATRKPVVEKPEDVQFGNLVSLSLTDFIYTTIFATFIITECFTSSKLSAVSGLPQGRVLPFVLYPILIAFGALGGAMGGAQLNPITTLALALTGMLPFNDWSVVFARMGAQIAGAGLGSWLLTAWAPSALGHCVSVFRPQVAPGLAMWQGVAVEGTISFIMHYAILRAGSLPKGSSFWSKVEMFGPPMVATILVSLAGPRTGAFMNPAMALGWGYQKGVHESVDHWVAYHAAPLLGAILAVLIFSSSANKQGSSNKLQKKES